MNHDKHFQDQRCSADVSFTNPVLPFNILLAGSIGDGRNWKNCTLPTHQKWNLPGPHKDWWWSSFGLDKF